ncbi:MAG: N-acetylmuramoyl-L-alanine amidase [Muribaculaceae bacterium]|nr:N-acetylmuramoyl-L-alanine amidase [Muribaculaceae bacterium]
MNCFSHRLRVLLALAVLSAGSAAWGYTVAIDAGHGGRDHGAVGSHCSEKDVTLAVAHALGTMIERECAGVHVCFTRNDDSYVELDERVRRAQAARADVLISLHANSMAHRPDLRSVTTGAATYVALAGSAAEKASLAGGGTRKSDEEIVFFELQQAELRQQSITFAREIQRALVEVTHRRDEGVHQANFHILQRAGMPAVLVEMDYISHPEAERFLGSPQGQESIAKALCKAFVTFYNKVNK